MSRARARRRHDCEPVIPYRLEGQPGVGAPGRPATPGTSEWDRIGTSFVERHNGTIRQQVRGFTRKTLAFSKKLRNLRAAVAVYVAWYNWVRSHGATPAMALGIEETFWTLERLLPR